MERSRFIPKLTDFLAIAVISLMLRGVMALAGILDFPWLAVPIILVMAYLWALVFRSLRTEPA